MRAWKDLLDKIDDRLERMVHGEALLEWSKPRPIWELETEEYCRRSREALPRMLIFGELSTGLALLSVHFFAPPIMPILWTLPFLIGGLVIGTFVGGPKHARMQGPGRYKITRRGIGLQGTSLFWAPWAAVRSYRLMEHPRAEALSAIEIRFQRRFDRSRRVFLPYDPGEVSEQRLRELLDKFLTRPTRNT